MVLRPPPEEIIRPWVPVESFSKRRVIVPLEVLPVAFVRVGQPSDFTFDQTFRQKAGGIGFRTNDGEDPEPITDQYNELSRNTTVVRIENPDDASQFVDVERIDDILFQGPGNRKVLFHLKNETP